MLFNIIIEISLLGLCLGESSKRAVSSVSFHREDVPLSYEYSSVHTYDNGKIKKDVDGKGSNYHYKKRAQPYNNIQYAPLNPIEEKFRRFNTKIIPAHTDRSIPEVSTNKNNIEPFQQYADNRHHNRNTIPLQYVAGHNIKVKNDIHQSYPNTKSSQFQEIASLPRYTSITEPQQIYKSSDIIHEKPIQPLHVLSSLESAQIQPVLNPYYVKAPRLHLNVARAYKVAHNTYEEPRSKRLTIHNSRSKQSFGPETEVLLDKRRILCPSKNIQ